MNGKVILITSKRNPGNITVREGPMPAADQPPRINPDSILKFINVAITQQVVTLTLEEWEHINEEILNPIHLRSSKEVPANNRSDYKFIGLTYKDDARSE